MGGHIHEYMVGKPCELGLSTGEYIRASVGMTLPAEEVLSWGPRAVFHLQENGYIFPVPIDRSDVVAEGLGSPGTGVVERDGVSDVPIPFGPHGERLDTPEPSVAEGDGTERTAIDVPLGETGVLEQEGEPGAVEVTPASYPHSLGGNKYLLSDGSKVSGRAAAIKRQAVLDEG